MNSNFEVIVLGVGSMGSSTCYHLAKRGISVLGLEQSSIVNEIGSHHGQSRIIRKAYFEHPDYVPLLKRSYDLWRELESESGQRLYTETGLLYAGDRDGILMKGIHESAEKHQIPIRSGSPKEVLVDYPVFNLPERFEVIHEPGAGFLSPEKCIQVHAAGAKSFGATIKDNTKVYGWKSSGNGFEVSTSQGVYRSEKLVLTAGAWTSMVLPGMEKFLKVTRQTVFWMDVNDPEKFAPDRFPCWLAEHEETGEFFYGFPILPVGDYGPPHGLKIAQHNPGFPVNPDYVRRKISFKERLHISSIFNEFFPVQIKEILHEQVCLYTYSPDEHFIIDVLPDNPRIVYAAGFSGHGFKFSSVVGEILADLSVIGKTELPIRFLAADRLR